MTTVESCAARASLWEKAAGIRNDRMSSGKSTAEIRKFAAEIRKSAAEKPVLH